MIKQIETYVRQKFKGWPAYERAAGLPKNHGKRRVKFYLAKLTALLKPLGLTVKIEEENELPNGFPTHTKDINGNVICLGDIVGYDFDDSTKSSYFEVVFEQNAFRKKRKRWDKSLPKPMLEFGNEAKQMRLIIIKPIKIEEDEKF